MCCKGLIVFAVAALAAANDIHEGANTHGLKPFFQGHYEGQWTLTRATKDVFVNTSGTISGINVTDLREAKDGEATIVSGGVGHDNVTISLKSPAVFRGYDFLIEVYSEEELERGSRGVEPSAPGVTVSPDTESKPTDKPVTASTEKPSTEVPTTDKAAVTFPTTGNPEVTLTTTTGKPDVTFGPVSHLTGKPEVSPLPTAEINGVPKMEMEVPEEIEDTPTRKNIGFRPPKINH